MKSLAVGLVASAIGFGMVLTSPADAAQRNKQRAYADQRYGGATVAPRSGPASPLVCWNGCGHPASIVMGTDPDPFIRSQILRQGSAFFGGID